MGLFKSTKCADLLLRPLGFKELDRNKEENWPN